MINHSFSIAKRNADCLWNILPHFDNVSKRKFKAISFMNAEYPRSAMRIDSKQHNTKIRVMTSGEMANVL